MNTNPFATLTGMLGAAALLGYGGYRYYEANKGSELMARV